MSINEQLLQIIQEVTQILRPQISTTLKQEPVMSKDNSTQELLNTLKIQILVLLELVTQNKSLEYDELEKTVQKAEAEIRSHVRLEQQMKLYADNLQEKIEQLEQEKQLLLDQDKKASTLQLNFISSKDQDKKQTNQSAQRETSPNVVKKSYIMGNQIYHRPHQSNLITYQDHQFPKNTSQEPINRERRSANTQHVSYVPTKGLPVKNNASLSSYNNPPSNRREDRNKSQQSQERIGDKSSSLLKQQHSYSYIKMYNIQKLIINKTLSDTKQQMKSKTIHGACNNNNNNINNNILDESHNKKK